MSNTSIPFGLGPESKPFDDVMLPALWLPPLPDFSDDFGYKPPGIEDFVPRRDDQNFAKMSTVA